MLCLESLTNNLFLVSLVQFVVFAILAPLRETFFSRKGARTQRKSEPTFG